MPINDQNKQVFGCFLQNIFYEFLIFMNFDLRGNVTDCTKFVYLFKNSQCALNYHSSSLGTGSINGLWFHLVQDFLQKLCVRFL